MKMIFKIITILVAVLSTAAVIAMFTRSKYTLVRKIVIHQPVNNVFDFIRHNNNQKKYSKWLSLDPDTKIALRGAADGTPGSILAFASSNKKVGKGEWETTHIILNERIDFQLRFLEPFAFVANGYFTTEALSSSQTTVTWVYNSGMDWPMNFMLLFLDMEKLVGNDIQASLESLKEHLESTPNVGN